jgi:hypothetical protein
MQRRAQHKAELEIISKDGKKFTVALASFDATPGSLRQHIGVGTFRIKAESFPATREAKPGDEISLFTTNLDTGVILNPFIGFIDRITDDFEKNPDTMEMIREEVIIQARSFPSVLTKHAIEGTFRFTKGYGEIVARIARKYGFDTKGVKYRQRKGTIHFNKMSTLEAFRRMAYLDHWRVYIQGKKIFFEPWKQPEDSGITLTDDNLIKGSYTRQ